MKDLTEIVRIAIATRNAIKHLSKTGIYFGFKTSGSQVSIFKFIDGYIQT